MMMSPKEATALLFALCAVPAVAVGAVYVEQTPPEAYIGAPAEPKSAWITTTSGALKGDHLIIKKSASDFFGSDWWGAGYRAGFDLWDWETGDASYLVGGMSLTAKGKVFDSEHEVAKLRVGAHNWGSEVTNGSIRVMGKTVKNWYLVNQPLNETYQKTMKFFDVEKDFPAVGPFTVSFGAKASGQVKLVPEVEMKDLRLTLSATPSARVDVSGHAGVSAWLVSAKAVGALEPLVEVSMPAEAYLQVRPNKSPCWEASLDLDLLTLKGSITLVVDYLVDTYKKTIASWGGKSYHFDLLSVGQACPTTMIPLEAFAIKWP